jgi:hypothetical protein
MKKTKRERAIEYIKYGKEIYNSNKDNSKKKEGYDFFMQGLESLIQCYKKESAPL